MKTMATGLSVALATSVLLSTAAGAAIKTEKRGSVHGARGTVWFDQTEGKPVVSFPLGCTGANCHYEIWLEYVPAGANPLDTDIFDRDLSDPEDPLLNSDRCYAWARLLPAVRIPFVRKPGVEHFLPGSSTPMTEFDAGWWWQASRSQTWARQKRMGWW